MVTPIKSSFPPIEKKTFFLNKQKVESLPDVVYRHQDSNAFSYSFCKFLNDFPFLCSSKLQEKLLLVCLFNICHLAKLFFFFRLIGPSYFAASIKISWILFIDILPCLGFPTTFSSLADILKYLYFHHFIILAPSVGCDSSKGFLTKIKNFTSTQIGTARDIFIYTGYKKWAFLISSKIGQD